MSPHGRAALSAVLVGLVLASVRDARAVQVGALESRWDWRLSGVRIEGDAEVPEADLRAEMLTVLRPWYALWRDDPEFDPTTLEGDVERIRGLYRTRGYYDATVGYDLELAADGERLVAVVYVDEGALAHVQEVVVAGGDAVPGADAPTLATLVPLVRDQPFVEARYREGAERLERWFRERGYGRAKVARTARVDLAVHGAWVRYEITPGPPCTFGDVTISGNAAVETEVVRREVAFVPGAPFRQSLLERTRTNLVALGLFSSVRVTPDGGDGARVDVEIEVVEGPPRSVRLGIGYDSEEQVRGLASWRHYDFLGGARQIGIAARYSLLRQSIVADLLEPHFPTQDSRVRLIALQQREDEDSYDLDRTRGTLRGEWEPVTGLVATAFYRAELASLFDVPEAVTRALPEAVPHNAILSSVGVGLDWNRTDDALDPRRGFFLRTAVEPVGGIFGGDVDFLRVFMELRGYVPLWAETLAAVRVRAGSADPFGRTHAVPIYERFFSGGTDSVRGYERWHVGRLVDGDPIGGKSLVEGAIELRRRVTESLTAVAFLDAGQVDRRSWRLPVDDLQLGTGLGIRYRTPIGPIRVDLGIPLDRPHGDAGWQVHFTVGPSF